MRGRRRCWTILSYLEAATRAATFVRTQLYDESRKVLVRSYREGRSEVEGFADDYAFVIQGLLDLYEASFDVNWLQFAITLQETQDRLFFDEAQGGYFSGTGQDPSILLRMKEDNDSAEPAASSVAALNLLRLAQFRNETALAGTSGENYRRLQSADQPFSECDATDAGGARFQSEHARGRS